MRSEVYVAIRERLESVVTDSARRYTVSDELGDDLLAGLVPVVWDILQERIDQPIRDINAMLNKLAEVPSAVDGGANMGGGAAPLAAIREDAGPPPAPSSDTEPPEPPTAHHDDGRECVYCQNCSTCIPHGVASRCWAAFDGVHVPRAAEAECLALGHDWTGSSIARVSCKRCLVYQDELANTESHVQDRKSHALAVWMVAEAKKRGITVSSLCEAIQREEEAYQEGWNEATEGADMKRDTSQDEANRLNRDIPHAGGTAIPVPVLDTKPEYADLASPTGPEGDPPRQRDEPPPYPVARDEADLVHTSSQSDKTDVGGGSLARSPSPASVPGQTPDADRCCCGSVRLASGITEALVHGTWHRRENPCYHWSVEGGEREVSGPVSERDDLDFWWDEVREATHELWGALQSVAGGLHGFDMLDSDYQPKRAAWAESQARQARQALERYRPLIGKLYDMAYPSNSATPSSRTSEGHEG